MKPIEIFAVSYICHQLSEGCEEKINAVHNDTIIPFISIYLGFIPFPCHKKWKAHTEPERRISFMEKIHSEGKVLNHLLNKYYWNEVNLNRDRICKSAARLLDRDCINKGGLDLSKEVLWVSVGQRAAELRAVKVGGHKKNSAKRPNSNPLCPRWADRQNLFFTSNFHSP